MNGRGKLTQRGENEKRETNRNKANKKAKNPKEKGRTKEERKIERRHTCNTIAGEKELSSHSNKWC
jgi:hypothetical protein